MLLFAARQLTDILLALERSICSLITFYMLLLMVEQQHE